MRVGRRFFSISKVFRSSLISELKSRELLSQVTSENIYEAQSKKLGVYLGADPTADSLHLGNLMPLMVLLHFYLRGHNVFPLIGGATGIVGDPSGRSSEREQMLVKQRDLNIEKISVQMKQILSNSLKVALKHRKLDSAPGEVTLVNNRSWWKDVNMLWFLGTFGRYFRIQTMISRESVKQRLDSEAGMGYNEFSYQILQAYDFYHLYRNHNCQCQIGGHDQWGNILGGVELINRLKDANEPEPLGLTVPLLLTPSGEKFGKSAGNAVFLSAERTSPYHMFQHLIKSPDEAVERYLKVFTFIPLNEIELIMAEHQKEPESRFAQQVLAKEVTELIHGPELAQSSQTISSVLFGGQDPPTSDILAAFRSQNLVTPIPKSELIGKQWKTLISELSNRSKSESQRLIKGSSVYFGPERNLLQDNLVDFLHISPEGLLLLRIGKTEYYAVEAIS